MALVVAWHWSRTAAVSCAEISCKSFERWGDRERGRKKERERQGERERDRDRERHTNTHTHTQRASRAQHVTETHSVQALVDGIKQAKIFL
jgi:hypothetical protein